MSRADTAYPSCLDSVVRDFVIKAVDRQLSVREQRGAVTPRANHCHCPDGCALYAQVALTVVFASRSVRQGWADGGEGVEAYFDDSNLVIAAARRNGARRTAAAVAA